MDERFISVFIRAGGYRLAAPVSESAATQEIQGLKLTFAMNSPGGLRQAALFPSVVQGYLTNRTGC